MSAAPKAVEKPKPAVPTQMANLRPKYIHSKETMQLGVDMAAMSATRGAKGITDMELMGPGVLVRWLTPDKRTGAALIPYGNLKTVVVEE